MVAQFGFPPSQKGTILPARALIDRQALDSVTGGDGALARELLILYAARAESLASTLSVTPPTQRRALQDLAHGARGSALAVGAQEVAQAAADLEAAADDASQEPEIGRARDTLRRRIADCRNEALALADRL